MGNLIGQTIRGYEIREQIGAGGYGAVYKAHEINVDRDVAVKVILPEHAAEPEFAQRFETEAQLVAQLEHPRIVPLYAYWRDDTGAFLVMRYVKEGSLFDVLEKQGAISLAQTSRLLDHITEALTVAHQAGVVHRDLKPDNILLDERGNAYLTDFGIAKQVDQPSNLTGADDIVGTLHYLSPEQIQNQPVSPRTDIYALGVMLYEMLTGQHPFQETSVTALIMKHLQEPLPPLDTIRPDLPIAIDDVVQKATAKDPDDRYDSVVDMLADFQTALQDDEPATTTRKEPPARLRASSPKERNRQAMLQNVRTFWVEGVLEQSLYNAVWIELGMSERAQAVENPWQTVLKMPNAHDETLPAGTTISETFDRLQGKLLILGQPGSGKTATLLTLTRDLLDRAEWDSAHPMPVVFNLSSWAYERKSLAAWMVDELNFKYQVPRKKGQQWMRNEQIMPLLDGLDEVAVEHRNACVRVINRYRRRHGFVDVVVCSRIADYKALTARLRLNGAIVLQPLQREQVDSYLAQAGEGLSAVRQVLEDDEKLRRLTTSPLMLNILTLAYRGMDIDDIQHFDTLENRRKHLFETYVERMLERRGKDTRYSPEKTKKYLAWLGKQMSDHSMSVFHIENLQRDWLGSRFQRGRFYIFTVGWMEYIAGCFLVFFLAGFLSVMFLDSSGDGITATEQTILFGAEILFIAYFIAKAFDFVSKSLAERTSRITPVEKIGWSWSKKQILRYTRRFSAFGFAIGLLTATSIYLDNIEASLGLLLVTPFIFAAYLAVLGTIYGATFGGITASEVAVRSTPNQGIRRSARNATISLLTFIPIGLLILWVMDFGVLFPLPAMLFTWIMASRFGIFTVIKHVELRRMLRRTGKIPTNLADFLDYSSENILMRKVGGGYMFIHRMLMDYFAESERAKEKPDADIERLALADGDDAILDEFFDEGEDNGLEQSHRPDR
jgi:serine/threonine protein kinase